MPRKIRILLALLLVAGMFGYRYWRDQRAGPADRPAASVAAEATKAPAIATPPPPRMFGRIAFRPCTLAAQFGPASVEAQCGTFSVPEDPARPDGRKLALNLAWVPAAADAEVAADAVFMLAGGPGQSAVDTYPQVAPAFRDVLKHRNVFLLDQRGTGKSNPLKCKPEDDAFDGSDLAAVRAATERCRDTLSRHADLRFYTTTDAVRDLEAVRIALGVPQLDLVGISYGTRVAQQYAMRHPASTRAIVLDSVAPNSLILGNDFAGNLERALDLQFARCEESVACTSAVGHPRAQLDALMATLRADPPLVRYRDAATGASREERLQPDAVAGLMRMYAYMPLVSSLLPLQLGEAAHGRYDGLMALSRMLGSSLGDQMAMGMQLSVICSEDASGFQADPDAEGTLLGNQFSEFLGAQCALWPKGAMPADFHQPLASTVPALVLEGEFDPVTPPRYGEDVVKTLPNARLLVLRGQGHNVIGAGCMPKLFAQFLQTADAKALDGKCLDTLGYVPPFVSFNGWEP
ncbi:alpha/beta hydrolase [Luteimonas sp. 50]|uniref:Proline iminopeptidase n=1 Tax=Cognatiluteimonas sedimenti TaxID=2927791 RepID=A0ABT0A5Q7_9GAMM|nr:alpha/beta hydrolase [Lysobacter sedimenti]MCJ0826302.1 alpha/beta hydrolase [Lysobacter sedimenti]